MNLRKFSKSFVTAMLFCMGFIFCATAEDAFRDKLINLGTAGEGGVFYTLGQEICAEVNEFREKSLIRCVTQATGGIDYNIQAVSSGQLQVAFSFSATTKYPFPENIRKLMNLYDAPIVMIVKNGSGISAPDQLRGKRINIGEPSSAKRRIINIVLENSGVSTSELIKIPPMETPASVQAFCNNELDAVIEALPIPNNYYNKLIKECGGAFIGFSNQFIDAAMSAEPRLEKQQINLEKFGLGNERNYQTVGQSVVLITSSNVDKEAIRRLAVNATTAMKKISKSQLFLTYWNQDYAFKKSGTLPAITKPTELSREK